MKANYLMKKSDRTVISLWTKNLTVDLPDLRKSTERGLCKYAGDFREKDRCRKERLNLEQMKTLK
jgi:hypothetical protein